MYLRHAKAVEKKAQVFREHAQPVVAGPLPRVRGLQVVGDHSVPCRDRADHVLPHPTVQTERVHEHDGGAITAGIGRFRLVVTRLTIRFGVGG